MNSEKIYIMGYGRSGSTICETLLSFRHRVNSFGEIKYLAERGVIRNEKCSCGQYAGDCTIWSDVIGRMGLHDYQKIADLTDRIESTKGFFYNLVRLNQKKFKADVIEYQRFYFKLNFELEQLGGFVDCSKNPARLFFLNYGQSSNLHDTVYWVVRDPRGVAWSCMKDMKRPEANSSRDKMMPKFGFFSSLGRWFLNSLVSLFVSKVIKNVKILKYEDIGILSAEVESIEADDLINHSISGNPRRLGGSFRHISKDVEWQTRLSTIQKLLGYCLCFPMMLFFGYKYK